MSLHCPPAVVDAFADAGVVVSVTAPPLVKIRDVAVLPIQTKVPLLVPFVQPEITNVWPMYAPFVP